MSTTRKWHKNFVKYTKFIINHPNYKELPFEYSKEGEIKWVVTGKSKEGLLRRAWWDKKCKENNIKIEPGCYARIAALIHPTKKHVCQICGKSLSIKYVYPNKRLLDYLCKEFDVSLEPYNKDIFEILDDLINKKEDIKKITKILKIKNNINNKADLKKYINKEFVDKRAKSFLSPGVMSNSPDRLDGFHSDGNCCRHESDKGRHKDNLKRYSQDRRVYENWADGDWKMADRLMACFSYHDLSADHIGPISLGFCHRPKFQPMKTEKNSAKNNRMTLRDVNILIQDELEGEQVVSWHSKYIWDILKKIVKTNEDAIKISNLMRKNLHHVLIIFSILDEEGFDKYLKRFLHPEFSFYDYKFIDFNPQDGSYSSFVKIKRIGKNQQNNAKRYVKIAFEELRKYKNIENRKTKIWNNKKVDKEIEELIKLIKRKEYLRSDKKIEEILILLAKDARNLW